MKSASLALYCAAALVDLAALVLILGAVPGQLRALTKPVPPEPDLPMSYNESLTAIEQILAARSPVIVDAGVRRGFNEVISALKAEVSTRQAGDRRLEQLSQIPRDRRHLLATVVLVTLGASLGMAGNIVGALG